MRMHLALLTLPAVCAMPIAAAGQGAETRRPLVKLQAVPFTQVKIKDRFWAPRRETNRKVSIPHSLDMLEKAGNLRNFDLAAAGKHEGYSGPVFMDSDLYKALEAASYSLAEKRDPALEARLDGFIAKVAAAQMADGYLNTHYQVNEPDRRWTNLRDNHEIYCAGHLFEAAVAHYQATGKRTLLEVACKLADHMSRLFGSGPGKRMGYCGHPEAELALIKLWRATGEERYFELARFFVENRGARFFATEHNTPLDRYDGTYWQDDVPIREHKNIKGHAVRAAYLMSGCVDVLAQTGDEGLRRMVNRVWRHTTEKSMYVTGGIGPSAHNEGFTTDYDLPNRTAYQETCASVAMALWNHRLALATGDAKYADIVEQALYNGVLAGVSLDGLRYFYVNPLESTGSHHRSEWFGCACCPPNVTRTLASLGQYAYATSSNGLWVNLYVQGSATARVGDTKVGVDVTSDYPWDGKIVLTLAPAKAAKFDLRLRIPGWCREAAFTINGAKSSKLATKNGYLVISRVWRAGDTVELNLAMPVERIEANPQVQEDRGQLALKRGPLVYCIEQADALAPVRDAAIPADAVFKPAAKPKLLGGITVLEGSGVLGSSEGWERTLYRAVAKPQRVPLTAIPYYAWDNRKAGAMKVWFPVTPPTPPAGGPEASAKIAASFVSSNCQPEGVNDGIEPKSSGEQPAALMHWWPHQGGTEWVQYTWKKPVTAERCRVYWFDDTGRGACRVPATWRIEYQDGKDWRPVAASEAYDVRMDRWCEVAFQPVKTAALRLVVEMQPKWAAGVHEWKVVVAEDEE